MTFTLTSQHVSLATKAGRTHAEAEHKLGLAVRDAIEKDPLTDEEDQRALVFAVTGQKLDVNGDDSKDLIAAYEDGYFDYWEEVAGG